MPIGKVAQNWLRPANVFSIAHSLPVPERPSEKQEAGNGLQARWIVRAGQMQLMSQILGSPA